MAAAERKAGWLADWLRITSTFQGCNCLLLHWGKTGIERPNYFAKLPIFSGSIANALNKNLFQCKFPSFHVALFARPRVFCWTKLKLKLCAALSEHGLRKNLSTQSKKNIYIKIKAETRPVAWQLQMEKCRSIFPFSTGIILLEIRWKLCFLPRRRRGATRSISVIKFTHVPSSPARGLLSVIVTVHREKKHDHGPGKMESKQRRAKRDEMLKHERNKWNDLTWELSCQAAKACFTRSHPHWGEDNLN